MRRLHTSRLSVLVALAGFAAALAACGERKEAAPGEATPPAAEEPKAVVPEASAPAAEPPAPAAEPPAPAAEPATAPAPAPQPASIELEIYKAGFIVGVSGGKGTLNFQGRRHALKIAGVSVGATAGISKAELVGDVQNLRRLADIEGTYSAPQAGIALGGGEKITRLENSKGVVLNVRGKQIGIEVAVDLNGMQISLAH
jgi:hypothetical protein